MISSARVSALRMSTERTPVVESESAETVDEEEEEVS